MRFTKMHGAGNDFVVLDRRDGSPLPPRHELAHMADRHTGIGCDQLMILTPAQRPGSVAGYRIVNQDGSDAGQCGNGARCLAAWLHRDGALQREGVLDSPAGPVFARVLDEGFEVSLSAPRFDAPSIPMTGVSSDESGHRLRVGDCDVRFGAVSMGNPHVVIEVDEITAAPVELAATLQSHPAFPGGCNVGFVQRVTRAHLRLRVIERGVGETLACGSGACAAHAWLHHQGRVDEHTAIDLPGGRLGATWAGGREEPVRLSGPATFVFEGTWNS
ncbi:diaminopimelate epimerase [Pseudofulvimonas gallinarii]|uniref:Diaminopimelate epimerase n=2 Tax=Pseudofulvimonas gallinarii TaxID=634155 RepID=A0A4V2UUV4_9GAMM|nr:diaminopimelate epimerase [Pseudofulvimonas gallinarii]